MLWYHCRGCILECLVKGGRCLGSGGHTAYPEIVGFLALLVVLSLFSCCFVVCTNMVIRSRICLYRILSMVCCMFCGIHMVWEFSCVVHWHLNLCVFICGSPFVFSRAWSWQQWYMVGGSLVEVCWLWVLGDHVVVVGGGGCVVQWARIQWSLEEGMFDDLVLISIWIGISGRVRMKVFVRSWIWGGYTIYRA